MKPGQGSASTVSPRCKKCRYAVVVKKRGFDGRPRQNGLPRLGNKNTMLAATSAHFATPHPPFRGLGLHSATTNATTRNKCTPRRTGSACSTSGRLASARHGRDIVG